MKLVALYSDSHEPLLREFFLPSFLKYPDGFSSLVIQRIPQGCSSGKYGDPGWESAMVHKVRVILKELRALSSGDSMVYSDVDVQWFSPIGKYLAEAFPESAAVFQVDVGMPCTGFMRLASCPEVFGAVEAALEALVSGRLRCDQIAFDESRKRLILPVEYFDPEEVWTARGSIWKLGDPVPEVPDKIRVHHGNWNFGVEAKLGIMAAVREQYLRKRS
jgi:hypothetical protein